MRMQGEDGICKPRKEALEEANAANSLTLTSASGTVKSPFCCSVPPLCSPLLWQLEQTNTVDFRSESTRELS